MKFPNGAKGVKRIFTAEILNLIGTLCMIIAVVLLVVGLAAAVGASDSDTGLGVFAGGSIGAAVLMVAFGILGIIAFIMNLIGIINAGHDEANFKSALVFLIMGIAASVISGFTVSTNGTLSGLMTSLHTLMDLLVTIFIISGCVRLADKLNRGDISAKGTNILKLLIVINVLGLIASLISSFMGGMVASVVAGVLALVALVLSLIQYILYLSFLSKAKKMLAEA